MLETKRKCITVSGDFDAEDELVSDAHRLHIASARRQNADARRRSRRCRCDADHVRIPAIIQPIPHQIPAPQTPGDVDPAPRNQFT